MLTPLQLFSLIFNAFSTLVCFFFCITLAMIKSNSRQHLYRRILFGLGVVCNILTETESLMRYNYLGDPTDRNFDLIQFSLGCAHNVLAYCFLCIHVFCLLERYERIHMSSLYLTWIRVYSVILTLSTIISEVIWKVDFIVFLQFHPFQIPSYSPSHYSRNVATLLTFFLATSTLFIEMIVTIRLVVTCVRADEQPDLWAGWRQQRTKLIHQLRLNLMYKMIFYAALLMMMGLGILLLVAIPAALRYDDIVTYTNIALAWTLLHCILSFKLMDLFLFKLKKVQRHAKNIQKVPSETSLDHLHQSYCFCFYCPRRQPTRSYQIPIGGEISSKDPSYFNSKTHNDDIQRPCSDSETGL